MLAGMPGIAWNRGMGDGDGGRLAHHWQGWGQVRPAADVGLAAQAMTDGDISSWCGAVPAFSAPTRRTWL